MSQKNSQILGAQWITPSLVEPEYLGSIFPEDSIFAEERISPEDLISPEDPIFREDPISPEDPIFREDPISPEDPIFREDPTFDEDPLLGEDPLFGGDTIFPEDPIPPEDPLTGRGRLGGSRVTALRNPHLQIHASTATPNHFRVIATVRVELSPWVRFALDYGLVDVVLQSRVLGIDGNILNGGHDHLFNFSDQIITGEGNFTFDTLVHRSVLNEDHSWFNNDDEIAARLNLISSDPAIPVNQWTMTNMIRGRY